MAVPVRPDHADFGVYVHGDAEGLLDRLAESRAPDADSRLPYFAALWPAGLALARHILGGPAWNGRCALDLGCGSGVVGFAAARAGADVSFLDRAPEVGFGLAATAAALRLPEPAFRAGDWDQLEWGRCFERILAADVLYEPPQAAGLVAFLVRHLAPNGEAWIADPGRNHALRLTPLAETAGLELLSHERLEPVSRGELDSAAVAGTADVVVSLSRYGWRS